MGIDKEKAKMPYETVLSGMLEKIRSREYEVGRFIPSERKLAEEYGVSRTVVHEAIRILSANGYLDSRLGGKRTLVRNDLLEDGNDDVYKTLEQSRVEEFLDARTYLDDIVVMLACRRATEEDLKKIEEVYRQMCAYCAREDTDILSNSLTKFHMVIANATHNNVIKSIYHLALTLMPTYRQSTLQTRTARIRMLKEHENIYLALKARNELEARFAAQLHNRKVMERWRKGRGQAFDPYQEQAAGAVASSDGELEL